MVAQVTTRSTLPVILTGIRGRDGEIARLRQLMRDPVVRMVTITGPGGVGKTRLAVAASSDADDDLDVIFVPLAAIREPERIVPAIGRAIGLSLDTATGVDTPLPLYAALRHRSTILILDNLEQIPGAGPVLGRLIEDVPDLTILATSQVVLDVPCECVFSLAPLKVPKEGARDARASESVLLFMERARAVDPGLDESDETHSAVADICRRLDGLPLAIELAAARVNVLSARALRDRLGDRLGLLGSQGGDADDRHRTLRAAIAWTYDLLDPIEQDLFRRLSVFTGGVSLDAARAVFEPNGERPVGEILEGLLRRNLLQPASTGDGAMRYLMLESLREFGVDQLVRRGEEVGARGAHAAWVCSLAEEAEQHLAGHDQVAWLSRLEDELGNIRAAVQWSLDDDRHEVAARIVSAIWQFFGNRAMIGDGRSWLGAALSGGAAVPPDVRSRALVASGYLASMHRADEDSQLLLEQARHLAATIGSTRDEIRAYRGLGLVSLNRGDLPQATALLNQSWALAHDTGDERGVASARASLGNVAYMEGRHAEAIGLWEETIEYWDRVGDAMMEAKTLSNLAAVKMVLRRRESIEESGEPDLLAEAEAHLHRALQLQQTINSRNEMTWTLMNLGAVAVARRDYRNARIYLTDAKKLLAETGDRIHQAVATQRLAMVANDEEDVAGSASLLLETLDLLGDNREPYRILEVVEVLSEIARGSHQDVVVLLAAVSRLREEHGIKMRVVLPEDLEKMKSEAQHALGTEVFATIWKSGESLDIDAVKSRARIIARRIVGRQVRGPEVVLPEAEVNPEPAAPSLDYSLTAREMDVLRLLGDGKGTQEIANDLAISTRTVMTHIGNILAKLDVTSRTAAVALAIREGVIPSGA